jgi:hypothetical protein
MTVQQLFTAFTRLPGEQKWQFFARMRLWELEQRDKLYDIAREVSHQFGMDWRDPRTGRNYPAPEKSSSHHGSRTSAHPPRRQKEKNRHRDPRGEKRS